MSECKGEFSHAFIVQFFGIREVEVKDIERFESFEAFTKLSESSRIKVDMGGWIEVELSEFRVFDKLGVLEGFKNKGVFLVL